MIIWRCDRCGQQTEMQGIVGKEFKYSNQYMTLAAPVGGMHDLCARCWTIAEKAIQAHREQMEKTQRDAIAAALVRA